LLFEIQKHFGCAYVANRGVECCVWDERKIFRQVFDFASGFSRVFGLFGENLMRFAGPPGFFI
jgi:hypothetical protein